MGQGGLGVLYEQAVVAYRKTNARPHASTSSPLTKATTWRSKRSAVSRTFISSLLTRTTPKPSKLSRLSLSRLSRPSDRQPDWFARAAQALQAQQAPQAAGVSPGGGDGFFSALKKLVFCPHGVLAGQYLNGCERCVREQKEIEENRRREQELQERKQQRQQRIKAAADSLKLKERSRLASSLIPSIKELRSLTPQHFEDEIARMFERLGYEVEQTPYVNDHGRDAILIKDGKKFRGGVQEIWRGSAARDDLELQKFHSAISDRSCGFRVLRHHRAI